MTDAEQPHDQQRRPGAEDPAPRRLPLRLEITAATERLAAAGVDSARFDAELLAAHVLGTERARLPMVPLIDQDLIERFHLLVDRRTTREPLQHITGRAHLGPIEVGVGSGVFVPRPETELLHAWALAYLQTLPAGRAPVVVDLCTGSRALALAIAHSRPDARVYGVESSPEALAWARRNADERTAAGDTPITLVHGDVTEADLLTDLDAEVDVVVTNPPYVPAGTEVSAEVAEHDPPEAVFAGEDGLAVIRPMVFTIARLLRIGGAVGVEHDDTNGGAVAELFRARRVFGEVAEHPDLAGRPRFVVARRVPTEAEARWCRPEPAD